MITRFEGELASMEYLDQVTSALPYHLLDQPRVLVLGAGGGADVLQALYQGATRIDAVELNPQVVELVNDEFADFSGALFTDPRVSVHISEARGFVTGHDGEYDLVQLALLDSFGASSAGLYALSENYLYTVEALGEILDTLRPGGILAITRWIKLPPRDGLKIFATAAAALERIGVVEPGQQMIMIRSWNTSTLLLSNRVSFRLARSTSYENSANSAGSTSFITRVSKPVRPTASTSCSKRGISLRPVNCWALKRSNSSRITSSISVPPRTTALISSTS